MEKEYDYHPEISGDVMQILRGAGWYEGRKIRIDALLEECMEDDVFPSDTQIAFIQEFGGLYGIQLNDEAGFWFSDRRVNRTFANLAKKQVRTEERWALHYHSADTLCVGCCNDGMDPVYLTPEGQLLTRSLAGRHGRRFEGSALKLPLKGQMSLENPISSHRAPLKGGAVRSSGVPRGYLSPRQGCGGSAPTIPQGARQTAVYPANDNRDFSCG